MPSPQVSARNNLCGAPAPQNILAGGNTINNNYNIINNIMQINCDKEREVSPSYSVFNKTAPFSGGYKQEVEVLDEAVIGAIQAKLGYSREEVRQMLKDESSFVSVLYQKMVEESCSGVSRSSFGGKPVHPSFVPSIVSSLSHASTNTNANPHNYYASLSQHNSVVSALMKKGGASSKTRATGGMENYEDESRYNSKVLMNQTMLSSSQASDCTGEQLNNTQPVHLKKSSLVEDAP